ncbi:Zinc finger protein 394-like 2 [Homarus americanus]|uniref:Zinc finger protein 394-like 2 n=1 Tax=Homarus americanus TaxID=6706 RepID=A0A8J5MTH1_HOMAM|nr:Zinc finger protein 394-like 2 [Homarus americanus]
MTRLLAGLGGTTGHPLSVTLHQDHPHHLQHRQDDVTMPYRCPFCSRRFRRRDGLVLHVRTHTGERPYACPHCPVAFAQKSHLNRHIRTVHKVEPNAHLAVHMNFNSDTPRSSQNDILGHSTTPARKKIESAKVDNQNGDTSESDILIPSPLFPHVQISNDTSGSALNQD